MPAFNAPEIDGKFIALKLKAEEKVCLGEIGCADADGLAVAAKTATGLKALGRVDHIEDDRIVIKKGVLRYANDGSDPVTAAEIAEDCYITDSTTVCKTSATNTKSVAGKVFAVDDAGVWVEF